jgi:hypothetical protein
MAASQIATETVAAQIAGLDAEVTRIDEQIAALTARREGIVMMQEALRPLVQQRAGAALTTVQANTPLPMVAATGDKTSTGTSTGFRAAVRNVLRDHPKGLKPAEVVLELGRRGDLTRYTGKVKPSVRIHNELYVLHKAGALARRNGKYMIPTPPPSGAVN